MNNPTFDMSRTLIMFSAGLGGAQYQIPMAMPGAVPRLQYPGLIGQQQAAALQG